MEIPENMVKHIEKINNGEYDIPYNHPKPIILDIGGNIGGFAIWASNKWKNATIYSYEPIKNNFDLLKKNIKDIDNIFAINVAVGSKNEKKEMFYGLNNIGECSFYKGVEQTDKTEIVDVMSGELLPKANIVKIDTEGAEIEILKSMTFEPEVFLIEYHSADNRRIIDNLLQKYTLIGGIIGAQTGVVKYALSSLIKYV
jgi:FkbM family methyltransferase